MRLTLSSLSPGQVWPQEDGAAAESLRCAGDHPHQCCRLPLQVVTFWVLTPPVWLWRRLELHDIQQNFALLLSPDGRTRSSSAGTVFCSVGLRSRIRPRPCADEPCQSWFQTGTITALGRLKCFSEPVRWLSWRDWEPRGYAAPLCSSRAGSEDGWRGPDTSGSDRQPSPSRSSAGELWPGGEWRPSALPLVREQIPHSTETRIWR